MDTALWASCVPLHEHHEHSQDKGLLLFGTEFDSHTHTHTHTHWDKKGWTPGLAQAGLSRLAGDVAKAIEESYNQASASYSFFRAGDWAIGDPARVASLKRHCIHAEGSEKDVLATMMKKVSTRVSKEVAAVPAEINHAVTRWPA